MKRKVSREKFENLKKLSNDNYIIAALAIDQRGSMKKMMHNFNVSEKDMETAIKKYKELVSASLTQYSSSILLDPIYGLEASQNRNENAGLLMSYEVTGYENGNNSRMPRIEKDWSVYKLKEVGAEAIKFLLYYDVDDSPVVNEQKKIIIERVGAECEAYNLPFFLEIITYDNHIDDEKGFEYAKFKPRKVIESMKEFAKKQYLVDVLKVEVPVNMNFVEGYAKDSDTVAYTKKEAQKYFIEQSQATKIPYIFLSGGERMELFKETLIFAKESGAKFHGVLCGRATWKDSVNTFATEGTKATEKWLNSIGKENIENLNNVLNQTATPFTDLYEVKQM